MTVDCLSFRRVLDYPTAVVRDVLVVLIELVLHLM